jgi:hypothetical protein
VDGKPVSNAEAIRLWKAGKNEPIGGPFKTVDESNSYAERFHQAEANRIGVSASPPKPTFEVPQSPPEKPLGRKVRMGGAEVYEGGVDKVARELSNRLRPLPDDALLKVAKRLGLPDAWVRDGDFFIGKGGKRVDDELSRSDFIDAIVKSSIAKNVSPLD